MKNHEKYIQRCLELAKNGIGTARPNPSVGAVIVYDNKIIGEGFTSVYGSSHAEVNAITSVKNKKLLQEATIYVTLEPCAHFGKTPPCANLIVQHKIPNVIIGCLDTNSLVAGKGIEILKNGGCNVIVGVLEEECKEFHKRFLTVQNKKRPYIILKWAVTQDGFIAPETKDKQKPVWISNSYSQQLVHKWRAEEHAILVGTNTVIADNPRLNVRSWFGNDPIRIVLDKNSRIPKNLNVLDESVKTIVITDNEKLKDESYKVESLRNQEPRTKNQELFSIRSEDRSLNNEEKKPIAKSQEPRAKNQELFSSGSEEENLNKNGQNPIAKSQQPTTNNQQPTTEYIDFTSRVAEQITAVLQKHKIQSVIIEGGRQTLQTFIDANLWDEARVFVGKTTFTKGVKAPKISKKITKQQSIGNDVLKIYKND